MLNLFWDVSQWPTTLIMFSMQPILLWTFSGKIENIRVEFTLFFFFFFSHFGETLKPKKNALRTALRLIHINQVQIKTFFWWQIFAKLWTFQNGKNVIF
jgi:hypothetical protein